MKPENHAIRQLEKQRGDATPEVADQIDRVIAALNTVLMNKGDEPALTFCRKGLIAEIEALEDLKRRA